MGQHLGTFNTLCLKKNMKCTWSASSNFIMNVAINVNEVIFILCSDMSNNIFRLSIYASPTCSLKTNLAKEFRAGPGSVQQIKVTLHEHHNVSNHRQRLFVQQLVQANARQKPHSSTWLAFIKWIHRWPLDSPHKGPVMRTMFSCHNVNMNLGPEKLDPEAISQTIFHRNSNPMEISSCSHPGCEQATALKFSIWHNGCAVFACAKFCNEMIPYYGVTLKIKFPSNLNHDGKIVREMGHRGPFH